MGRFYEVVCFSIRVSIRVFLFEKESFILSSFFSFNYGTEKIFVESNSDVIANLMSFLDYYLKNLPF